MKKRIMSFLLVLALALAGFFGGCIQSRKYYEFELTEKQKTEIALRAAQQVIEAQKINK